MSIVTGHWKSIYLIKLILKFKNLGSDSTGILNLGASKAGFHRRMTYDDLLPHSHNPLPFHHPGKPVGDAQYGTSLAGPFQGLQHHFFRVAVQVGGDFIQ